MTPQISPGLNRNPPAGTAVGSIEFGSAKSLSEPPHLQREYYSVAFAFELDAPEVYGVRIQLSRERQYIYPAFVVEKWQRKVLDIELLCPLSGFRMADGIVIPVHKARVVLCSNRSLMVHCTNHVARCFISDPATTEAILKVATVIDERKKEALNG